MILEKYKIHLFQNIKKTLSDWLSSDVNELIPSAEVYRFLHSIKGTAGTLQLGGLMQLSEFLIDRLEEDERLDWDKNRLQTFLFDLMELTYEYEHFDELGIMDVTVRDTHAPLIQIIDDDVSMLILLKDVLENRGWMVTTNTDPVKAVSQYFEMQPDCLILDIHLPMKDGFSVLQDIQQHNEKYFIPKIMISVQNDKQSRIKAYRMGADDFVGKPIDIEEFVVKVDRHLQRKKLFDQSVLIDELTQVYNRRFLDESMPRYFQDFKRTRQMFSICLVDLDHFKRVNDTYGHLLGDQVLMEFAQYVKCNIRSTDVVYRYGGEEFVIILPRTCNDDAKSLLDKLIEGFSEKVFYHNLESFSVTFSAGLFTVKNEEATPEEAFKMADMSLYSAKRNGRAKVESIQIADSNYKNKKINVSVIDDDIIIRTMLSQMLQSLSVEHLDLNISVYENGRDFFQSPRSQEDIEHFLILDGVMPIMDGIEVLKKVKKGENADRYTVLMLTGRKGENDIASALKLGADDYVTKPFSMTELQARVERLLKRVKK